jgi:dCTP diphosphatase
MNPTESIYQTLFEELHLAAAARIQAHDAAPPMTPRDHVLQLGVVVGNLCSLFLTHAPLDPRREPLDTVPIPEEKENEPLFWTTESIGRRNIFNGLGNVLAEIILAVEACEMEIGVCILKKMKLNEKKYPVELVKGRSGKYTSYSDQTGITKTKGQSTLEMQIHDEGVKTVEEMMVFIQKFATDRLWSRFHTPRSLVLAIMGELGELAELFQWKGDGEANGMEGWTQEDLDHVGQEFADVAIYLLRLADVCCAKEIGALALANLRETAEV